MYLAQDAFNAGIYLKEGSHIQFCILPFGTGNDTS
jgi:diacylglycerol kinase family enzyme